MWGHNYFLLLFLFHPRWCTILCENKLLSCHILTDGGQSLTSNKSRLEPHVIGHKSNKSFFLSAVAFLDPKTKKNNNKTVNNEKRQLCAIDAPFSLQQRHCISRMCFPEAVWRSRVFSLKSCHGPELVLYDMRYISPVIQCGNNPSGKRSLLFACLLCLSPPFSRTFQGNSHDENTERGNLSMYQICWEASESEVQLHRHRERRGGTGLRSSRGRGGRGGETFISRLNFVLFVTEYKKYSAVTSPLINTLRNVHPPRVVCVCFCLCNMQTSRLFIAGGER